MTDDVAVVLAFNGPAEWLAVVLDGRVDVWQVSEPNTHRGGPTASE